MAEIDRSTVEHIAQLARLALSEDEIVGLTQDLAEILAYVENLDRLDLDGIEPTAHPFLANMPLRQDENRPSLDWTRLERNAPDTEDRQFRVPRIIGDDS